MTAMLSAPLDVFLAGGIAVLLVAGATLIILRRNMKPGVNVCPPKTAECRPASHDPYVDEVPTDHEMIHMMRDTLESSHWSESTRAAAMSEQLAFGRGNYGPVPQINEQEPVPWVSLIAHMGLVCLANVVVTILVWFATQQVYLLVIGLTMAIALPTWLVLSVAMDMKGLSIRNVFRR